MTYSAVVASQYSSRGIYVHRSNSYTVLGRVNVYITAHTEEDAQSAVQNLADEFSSVSFGAPVYNKYNDAGWIIIGCAWN